MKKEKGFSLIELLITVGIIAILSMVCYPLYSSFIKRVYIAEIYQAVFTFARKGVAAKTGDYDSDIYGINDFMKNIPSARDRCHGQNGAKEGLILREWDLNANQVAAILGVSPKYLSDGRYTGLTDIQCSNPKLYTESMFTVSFDSKKLMGSDKDPDGSPYRLVFYFPTSYGAIYKNSKNQIIKEVDGWVTQCAIAGGGISAVVGFSQKYQLAVIPEHCLYMWQMDINNPNDGWSIGQENNKSVYMKIEPWDPK